MKKTNTWRRREKYKRRQRLFTTILFTAAIVLVGTKLQQNDKENNANANAQKPAVYFSVFQTPRWNYRNTTTPAFLSLVLKIEANAAATTDAGVLEEYSQPADNAPDVSGCKEPVLDWIDVPIQPYQNKKLYMARCTPTPTHNVSMMYAGNNVLFIKPCGTWCNTREAVVQCFEYDIEFVW